MAYALGIDFGTLSGRVLLLDLETGAERAVEEVHYPHGVIDRVLPGTSHSLPPDWSLQDPGDYLTVLHRGVPAVLRRAGVDGNAVVGIGIDFTSCTVLPTTADGTPLCQLDRFAGHPHAWPKLWKHHAAQPWADRLTAVAESRREPFLARYGGRISSEWYFPKLFEVYFEDQEVYEGMAHFVEATDWIVWQLTGTLARNSCTAGYKALWTPDHGFPDWDYFRAVDPTFPPPAEKIGTTFYPLGTRAGTLKPELAKAWGLSDSVAVAVGNVDAHVSMVGAGVTAPGTMVMVIGTSICDLVITDDEQLVPGITGVIRDGVIPGYFGYEAGQVAVGDMYAWFCEHALPPRYHEAADRRGISVYTYLEELATPLEPGATGLLALDWWNGNRSVLGDADISGLVVGLSLATQPEEIYRALLESTAFGSRVIVENFRRHGVPIDAIVACGGIAHRSPLLMQLYADIIGVPVRVLDSSETPARGSAIFGAVAHAGGDPKALSMLTERLAPAVATTYEPRDAYRVPYDTLFNWYQELYETFGRTRKDLMHGLKALRQQTH
jgi:L-ribulokinase